MRSSDSTSDPADRFLPGQLLAGRYRVVEQVGRGGTGEVYRAHDLKLGQAVALKFLPGEVARDPARLQSLFAEVRVARQVSHPNVCRVHDVGEMEGTHFLSMEFVDGEDLASLLTRIGRLPADKAVEIAREMCAGLAAIHDRGVLHRDLKPANVMIDGRGHARITDFGLAEIEGRAGEDGTISGTPAYMAPESFTSDAPHTPRADLYSLGLVMFELFTGRRAFEAASLGELIRLRRETAAPSPRRHLPDLDPDIESVILRCLERDPARRPASAAAIARALPGDPLSALVAAGATPSPEQVAAGSPAAEGLRAGAAWGGLAALLAGLLVATALAPRTRLVSALTLPDPPEAMAARAHEMIRGAAPAARDVDRAYGYEFDQAAVERILANDRSKSRWQALSARMSGDSPGDPPVVSFWYRQSSAEMVASPPWYRVAYSDPLPVSSGNVGIRLDAAGRILRRDGATNGEEFTAPATPSPPPPADPSRRITTTIGRSVRPALFLAALFLGAWLARRNLRAGRGDTRRALRVAGGMMALRAVTWILGAHLTPSSVTEQLTTTVAWGLYDFAYGWVFYVAIEPYVRRLWPRVLTSWIRLLDGRHRDANVGRDLLIGTLTGTVLALAVAAHQAAPVLFGAPPGRPDNVGYVEHQLASLLGLRHQIAEILGLARSNLVLMMGFTVILVAARVLLRNSRLAVAVAFLVFVPLALPRGEWVALNLAFAMLATAILLFVLMRFGLLAAGIGLVTNTVLQSAPLGMGLGSWPASRTVLVLALVLGVGLYGFARSLGGRPAIRDLPADADPTLAAG